jgi:HlyD family secretion protein
MPESKTRLWWRRTALGAVILAAVAGFAYALWPKPVAVDLASISHGELRVTIDEEGKTRIKDVYIVSAPISGRLPRSPVHVGDQVLAGTTAVASIAPSAPPLLDVRSKSEMQAQAAAASAAVTLAEAELRQAKAEATLSISDLERSRKLARQGFLAANALDRAETDSKVKQDAVHRAESNLEVRQRELASASARLMDPPLSGAVTGDATAGPAAVLVYPPVSGRVLKLVVESEQDVSIGAPLLEIGDPSDLEIIVDLLSQDAVRVRPGAAARIEGWGGSQALPAKVRSIEPIGFTKVSALGIEEQRVRTTLDFEGPPTNHAALGHDFRVFVRIVDWESADALRVPLGALFRDRDQWAVFRLASGRARLQHIEIGHRNAEFAEILSGVAAGDQVVLHPSDLVIDGTRITPRS